MLHWESDKMAVARNTRSKQQFLSPQAKALEYIHNRSDPCHITKRYIDEYKGWGVFATSIIPKGSFILNYQGTLIKSKEVKLQLEKLYNDSNMGSYIYEFKHREKSMWIDATTIKNSLGRLVNDSRYFPNSAMKKIVSYNEPHLCLFALRDINPGEEILYFYGELEMPWYKEIQSEILPMEESSKDDHDKEVIAESDHEERIDDVVLQGMLDEVIAESDHDEKIADVVLQGLLDKIVLRTEADKEESNVKKYPKEDEVIKLRKDMLTFDDESDTEVDFCLSEKTCLKEMKAVVSTLLQDNEEPNKLTDLPFLTSTAKKEKTKRRKWNIGDFVKKPCRQRKVKWSVKNFLEEPCEEGENPVRDKKLLLSLNESCDSVGALPFASNNSLTDDSGIHGDLPDIENTPNNSVSSDIADPISDTEDGDKHKRPGRYCIFCGKIRQKLTRHIKLKHGKEERVKAALEKSKKEKDKLFAEMRWDGIIEFNKHQATLDEPTYQSEKKGKNSSPLTRCSFCNITVVKSNFSRHKLRCSLKTNEPVASIPNSLFQVPHLSNYDKEFQTNVLAKLRIDKIGEICRTDENILQIASKFFWKVKQKKDKLNEICKGIRGDMRRLAYLYVIFREEEGIVYHHGNSLDMFNRRNYELLAKAIEKYVAKDNSEDIKAGLKLNLCFLIKRATEDLKNHFYACAKDDEGKEMNKFIATFKAWEKHLFGDATYQINKQRQVNLRKPAKLPLEEDLSKLRTHLISRIEELCSEFEFNDKHAYVELRDAACTRLTLLNGRRGGEPARLMLKDWQDAESNAWIDQQRLKSLDNADQQLVKSMKISYMTGKGNNHLVPVLIPPDTVPAITKLASSPFRKAAGVMQTNKFLFASSQNSSSHVSGWHAMNKLCRKLSLSSTDQLIATNNRHRISTLFASLDLPRQDRELFFSHMGHSEKINQDTYQAPLAIHTITKVGKHLLQIDSGEQQVAPQCNDQLPEDSKSHKGEQTLTQCNDQLLNKPKNSNGELPNEEQRISLCNDQLPNNSKNYKGKSYGLRKKAEKVLTNNVLNSDSDTDYVVSQEDNGIAYDVGNDWHTLKESKGRNYRQWNKEIGNKLFVSFGNFIKRKESSWPGREEINKFIKENELELSYYNVRTKLTNERVKWDRLHKAKSTKTKQRLKELNLH